MTTTMVKKLLSGGNPCKKCEQAEDMLRRRGLWERIDRVVTAVEDDPDSEGMRLARQHDVALAPFFMDEQDGNVQVFTSTPLFAKHLQASAAVSSQASTSGTDDVLAPEAALSDERFAFVDDTPPGQILSTALAVFGERCAISFSGAEDVVLIDMASRSGLPFSVFTLDTGRLHEETLEFIERVRKHYGVVIEVLTPDPAELVPFVRNKGLFSFYDDGHQQCCAIRKVAPLRRALSRFDAQVTGQRHDQSMTRKALPLVQLDPLFQGRRGGLLKLNPLAHWSSARVWQYIRDNDVPSNTLHERGFVSIGCAPCTRPPRPGEHERAGRWWWEEETARECGLHAKK